MDGAGNHHVKQNKPDSERERAHFLSWAESVLIWGKEKDHQKEGGELRRDNNSLWQAIVSALTSVLCGEKLLWWGWAPHRSMCKRIHTGRQLGAMAIYQNVINLFTNCLVKILSEYLRSEDQHPLCLDHQGIWNLTFVAQFSHTAPPQIPTSSPTLSHPCTLGLFHSPALADPTTCSDSELPNQSCLLDSIRIIPDHPPPNRLKNPPPLISF